MREDIDVVMARVENAIREAHDSHPICNQSGYAFGYEPEPTGGDGWWMTVADLRTVLAALREARADAARLNERYARLARKAKVYRRQMRGQQLALERQQREVERLMLLGIQTARNNAIDAARAAGGTNG